MLLHDNSDSLPLRLTIAQSVVSVSARISHRAQASHLHCLLCLPHSVSVMASPSFVLLCPASPSLLFHLPAALLSHVCSYLLPNELLVTLARTAEATRELLTPAGFSPDALELHSSAGRDLCSLDRPHRDALRSFHCRILSDSRIELHLEQDGSMQQLLAALDCFPASKGSM